MLRPADLSLESVVALADLPIPGFPKSPEVLPEPSPKEGSEDKGGAIASAGVVGDEVKAEEEEDDVMEFACTELGAFVVECSSNSETSGGILQVQRARLDKTKLFVIVCNCCVCGCVIKRIVL